MVSHQTFNCAAIATVVTVAEILKNSGFAVEKSKKDLLNLEYCYKRSSK